MSQTTTSITMSCFGCGKPLEIYSTTHYLNGAMYCQKCIYIIKSAGVAESKTIDNLKIQIENLQGKIKEIRKIAK